MKSFQQVSSEVWTPLSGSGGEFLQPPRAAFPLIPTLASADFFKVYMLGAKEEEWGPDSSLPHQALGRGKAHTYLHFLLVAIFLKYLFPSLYSQSVCVLKAKMSMLQAVYHWVLWFFCFFLIHLSCYWRSYSIYI